MKSALGPGGLGPRRPLPRRRSGPGPGPGPFEPARTRSRPSLSLSPSSSSSDLSCRSYEADGPVHTTILFDVMDTIVRDPFYTKMPPYFGLTFEELLAVKHPTAWIDFESGRLTEDEFFATFFEDGRSIDREDFVQRVLLDHYEILPGMESLLGALRRNGYDMRAFSNYPVWYEYVERACGLSRYLTWEFVSCLPPLADGGFRKPSLESFEVVWKVVQEGGEGVGKTRVLFVDDRPANVEAAERVGMEGILFEGAEALEARLCELGIVVKGGLE